MGRKKPKLTEALCGVALLLGIASIAITPVYLLLMCYFGKDFLPQRLVIVNVILAVCILIFIAVFIFMWISEHRKNNKQ